MAFTAGPVSCFPWPTWQGSALISTLWAAGINFKAEPPSQYDGQLKKPAGELWSNVDLTSEKGGTVTKPASMALMPLELPAEPYAEPLRANVDARMDEVPTNHPGLH